MEQNAIRPGLMAVECARRVRSDKHDVRERRARCAALAEGWCTG
ncbi:hypothetical protein V6Z11_D13G195300 [Gossypium hirsutum]